MSRFASLPERSVAWIAFALAALVYGLTLCRTIYTGDDGDFELAMATLGVCHPTGYPLFTLLGSAFLRGLAPLVDEPALRVNLMTALFGAGAVGMLCRLLHAVTGSKVVGLSGALLVGFAPTLWQQSLSCEVYTLTALFLVTVLWLCVRLERGEVRVLGWIVLVYGLSLTNNLTMGLFLPGFLWFVWRRVGFKKLILSLPLFLLPLLLYAYIPLVARWGQSPLVWGDPQTPTRFFEHVNGSQYRPWMFTQPLATWHLRLWNYAHDFLWKELGGHFLIFAVPGMIVLWKCQRALLALTAWVFMVDIVYATNYAIADIYVYYLPSYLAVAVWIAAGLEAARRRIAKPQPMLSRPIALLLVLTPIVQMTTHLAATDKSSNYLEADFGQNILRSAPQNAIVLTSNNTTFTLWYWKWLKEVRPDVTTINVDLLEGTVSNNESWYFEHIFRQWPSLPAPTGLPTNETNDGTYLQLLVRGALAEGRAVLLVSDDRIDSKPTEPGQPSLNTRLASFSRRPWGIAQRLYEPGTEPSDSELLAQNQTLWQSFTRRGVYTSAHESDPLQLHLFVRYFFAHKALGQLAEKLGQKDLAREHYTGAFSIFTEPEVERRLRALLVAP